MINRGSEPIMATKEAYSSTGSVTKADGNNQIIGGWFSVFTVDGDTVVDSDNEEVDIPSYNKVFIDFSKNYRDANFDHEGSVKGTLIDNILIDSVDMAKMLVSEITGLDYADIPVKKLGHFGSFQINDPEDYANAVANKLMFSIEGQCTRVEVDDE